MILFFCFIVNNDLILFSYFQETKLSFTFFIYITGKILVLLHIRYTLTILSGIPFFRIFYSLLLNLLIPKYLHNYFYTYFFIIYLVLALFFIFTIYYFFKGITTIIYMIFILLNNAIYLLSFMTLLISDFV